MDPIEERPKRTIHEPTRYQTTSSDEVPRRKKQRVTEDLDETLRTLESSSESENPNNAHLQNKGDISTKLDRILEMLEKIAESNVCERLTVVEAELKKMNGLLCRKLDIEETNDAQRPQCLPFQTIEEVDNFDNSSAEEYRSVVTYFCYIGGYSLKEAVNASFREAIADSLVSSYTWFGTDICKPLYKTKIMHAIFDAVCKNKKFTKPTRREFQEFMRVALRTAKERVRHKKQTDTPTKPSGYWGQEDQENLQQEKQELKVKKEEEITEEKF